MPVLSELCSICYAEPKYKCPRCGARTCSVTCIQKHKKRRNCDGQRDPTAFVPVTQLRTAAGVDHDYNFLASIERARQRSEKDIIEARRLLSEKELRPANEEKQFRKVWHGDELRHLPVAPSSSFQSHGQGRPHHQQNEADTVIADGFDKHVRRRLRILDIDAVAMPKGLARRKENTTAWNRRTLSVNWQVEWFIFSASVPEHTTQPTRILHKILEGKPLNAALASTLEWHRGQLDRQNRGAQDNNDDDNDPEPSADEDAPARPKKKKKAKNWKKRRLQELLATELPTQDWASGTWPSSPYTLQYPLTGAWSRTASSAAVPMTSDELIADYARWRFFLLAPSTPKDNKSSKQPGSSNITTSSNKILIPLSSTETLATALAGRTILEFPTLYVLPPLPSGQQQQLPEGFALGSTERRNPKPKEEENNNNSGDEQQDASRSAVRAPLSQKQAFQRELRNQRNNNDTQNTRNKNNDNSSNNKRRGAAGPFPGGRPEKRARFERHGGCGQPGGEEGEVVEPHEVEEGEVEAEEGEVNSDGDEVMMGGGGEQQQQQQQQQQSYGEENESKPATKSLGGLLVDYDSEGMLD
ncbi:hypothetical protein B0T17DRAFT_586615 [Bombardia bombarda]|uniref:HIT-type domain-containing protein n=1 Tax=Bombardia bombarda TaxID=252184 RepID=A0AA39XJ44_9PEZI|nr:hypothetical protein B0T17DRAFT_586615 [Bombardia bombarda]